jgi:FtsZ-interacting cell division protein ZipA
MTKKTESSDSNEEKRVFDVSKPGETAAGPNSRPVIVRRSMIKKDPMFSGDGEKSKAEAEDEEKPGKAEPLAVSVKDVPDPEAKQENAEEKTGKKGKKEEQPDAAPDNQADEVQPEADKQTETKSEDSDQPKPETEAPQDDASADDEPKNSDAATVETLAGDAKTAREAKNQSKENEEAAKERQKLIDSKQYFLNIGEAKRRKTGARVLTVLIILLILAGVAYLLALDAEIIEGSIEPLTDIL